MRIKRRFTPAEVLLRHFILLAESDDGWNGSIELDNLLDAAREHLAETDANPGDLGESQELPC